MNANRPSDGRVVAVEFIKTDRNYKWSRKLLSFSLIFSSLHPFRIYNEQPIGIAERRSFLRKFWTVSSIPISVYLCTKPLLSVLLRLIRNTLSAKVAFKNLELVEQLSCILKVIGDPLANLKYIDWNITVFFPCFAFWIRCYLPIYYARFDPFDSAFVRFILRPREEIRRFDVRATRMLSQMIEVLKIRQYNLSHCLRLNQDGLMGPEYFLFRELQITERQIDELQRVQHQMQLIRPDSLSPDWHKHSNTMIIMLLLSWMPFNILCSIVIMSFYTYVNLRRCCELGRYYVAHKDSDWMGCILSYVFSLSDLLMMLEIDLMIVVFAIASVTVDMSLHVLQIYHQLQLTKSVTRRLRKLVAEIQNFDLDEEMKVEEIIFNRRLSSRLCTNLVGMRMFHLETRRCVKALAHTASYGIAVCLTFTVASFATIRAQRAHANNWQADSEVMDAGALAGRFLREANAIVFVAWLLLWSSANVLILGCAIIPSRITGLDRSLYSLVAQLVRLQNKRRSSTQLEMLNVRRRSMGDLISVEDPITSFWRRLAHNGNYMREMLTVCIFTNRLTYERVLAINFYALTIVSLLTMYI